MELSLLDFFGAIPTSARAGTSNPISSRGRHHCQQPTMVKPLFCPVRLIFLSFRNSYL